MIRHKKNRCTLLTKTKKNIGYIGENVECIEDIRNSRDKVDNPLI